VWVFCLQLLCLQQRQSSRVRHKSHGPVSNADIQFRCPQPARHQLILGDHRCVASASCSMPVYFRAETGPYLLTAEGWKTELAYSWLITQCRICIFGGPRLDTVMGPAYLPFSHRTPPFLEATSWHMGSLLFSLKLFPKRIIFAMHEHLNARNIY